MSGLRVRVKARVKVRVGVRVRVKARVRVRVSARIRARVSRETGSLPPSGCLLPPERGVGVRALGKCQG